MKKSRIVPVGPQRSSWWVCKVLPVFVVFCLMASPAWSQQQHGRKKVAVVLSGGGAKGMAHIGALKVIEQAGIPIDIVTGTSMGSIIGGLYAVGYNAAVLDSLARTLDWNYVISDRENLAEQSLADREKQFVYSLSTGLTVGKKNRNDGGLIKGKNLDELFQQLFYGYTDSLNFSKDLPIAFACVATNIVDNTEVDFHSGRLPEALRASMAIPGAFSPVRVGDMVLVDGGLRNNYPADIARAMGADIIIGVTVQGKEKTADDLVGPMSILSQIIDVNCKNKYDENLAMTDVAIRANTTGYTAASFTPAAIDTLIRRGQEEAMTHWDELIALKKRIGISDDFRPTVLHPVRPFVVGDRQRVAEYVFKNMTSTDEKYLRQKFHLSRRDSIDAELIQQLTTCMRIDLNYQTAECQMLPVGKSGDVQAVLIAGNRKTAQVYAGFRFDSEEYAALQLGASIPLKGSLPTNLEMTMRLSKRLMARAELIMHERSFTTPKFSYTFWRNDLDIYSDGDLDYNVRYNQHVAELLPLNFNLKNFNFQAGLRWNHFHYRNTLVASRKSDIPLVSDHYFSYHARVNYDSEDSPYFPTRGSRFKAEYAYLTDDFGGMNNRSGISEVKVVWRTAIAFGSRFTLQPMIYSRMLFGTSIPLSFCNAIGGTFFGHYVEQQMPFAGVGNMEVVERHFAAAQILAQQRIGNNQYLQLRVSGGAQAKSLKNIFDKKLLAGVQASYYVMIPVIGPAGVSVGYSNKTKEPYFFLNLGYEF